MMLYLLLPIVVQLGWGALEVPPDRTDYLFAAVVHHAMEKSEAELSVDPRLIRLPDGQLLPDPTSYVVGGEAEAKGRAEMLGRMGVVARGVVPFVEACDGLLVPPGLKDVSGCPSDSAVHIAVDLIDDPPEDAIEVKLRKIEVYYQVHGRSATVFEVTVQKGQAGWFVADEVALWFVD